MRPVFHSGRIAVHHRLTDARGKRRGGEDHIPLERAHHRCADRTADVGHLIDLLIAFLLCGRAAGRRAPVDPRRARRQLAKLVHFRGRQNLMEMEHHGLIERFGSEDKRGCDTATFGD